jgi:hypothetical protein
MSAPPIPKAEQKRTRDAWKKSNFNQCLASKLLGISRSGMQARVRILGLTVPTPKAGKPIDHEMQRVGDELKNLKNALRVANKALNDADDLRTAVFNLAQQTTDPPEWLLNAHKGPAVAQVPILFFSDFHLGEYIKAGEMDGINAFDQHVAEERYRKMIEATVNLAFDHMGRAIPKYPGIIYLRGGDLVSGDIHDLKETNDLKAIPAVKKLVAMERWGLAKLRMHFKNVWVITIPGNHGRDSVLPHSKENSDRNFDTLSAYMLEVSCEGSSYSFWTPESGDALFKVLGHTFLATHGDRIGTGGGRGFVGPAAPIARGAKLLANYYSALGYGVDYTLLGHFHTRLEIDNVFANGCVCGYSQYGKQFRFVPRPAEQWLLFVDAKHGITARWALQLSSKPAMPNAKPFEKVN